MNTRQFHGELNKSSPDSSLSDIKTKGESVGGGDTNAGDGDCTENKRRSLDSVRIRNLFQELLTVARDMNEKFLDQTVDSMKISLQYAIEGHLDRLSSALLDKTRPFGTNQSEVYSDITKGCLSRVHDSIPSDLTKMITKNLIPELEAKLNILSSELATTVCDAFVEDEIDGLDHSNQYLLDKTLPKLLPKIQDMRTPVWVRRLEEESSTDKPPRLYSAAQFLNQVAMARFSSIPITSETNGNEMHRFIGLEDVRPFSKLNKEQKCHQQNFPVDNENNSIRANSYGTVSSSTLNNANENANFSNPNISGNCGSFVGKCKPDTTSENTTREKTRSIKFVKTVDTSSASTHPINSEQLDHVSGNKITPGEKVKRFLTREVDPLLSQTPKDRKTPGKTANEKQKTSVADINHKTGNSDGHTQGTRCLHVEVDSPTRAHSSSSSPKVDSFRLEPLLLGGVESPGSRRPRQTALDDPIVMVARDELTGRPPVSYGTTMVSQLPRHFIDDISNSKDRINDSARRGPRRGCSLTESNFQWEEAFRKDLYYTPCVADSSESDANESGSWRRHMHIDLNQKPTTVTKSKWSTTRWDKPEWYSDHNTDGEFPSSCPEKESPIQRFTNYNLPASHPQRQRSSPSIYHKLSGYASDSRHSTVSRTVTLPEMPSNNQEDMNAPMEAPGRRERSKQFARLKLFFERNSSPKPQSSDSNIRRNKPKPGRRKNTGFKTGDLSGHSSNMEEEQSDLPRLDSVGAPSGPESSPAAINPGYKPPQSSVAKMKRYSRPTSTATLSLSPAPPQPITATVTATAVTVTTATATSTASQSISTTDQIRSQPTGKSQSSISDTVTKLTNSKNALMKEDHEKSIDKPALRGSTYAAPDTIPTREEHLSTSTITTTKSEANPPTASSMGPKLTQIGFARPKRQKTRAGSRASFSRSISAVQTTDDEDLFSGSISGWGAQPGDNIPTNSLSHVRGECDGVDPLEDPEAEHIPDLTAFKLIGSIVDSDVDSDTEGRIKIRFRGVPMPGLVGPNAQNMLAEIKQKTHLRSHETRSRSSNPVETRSPISELQRAISLLRPSSKTQNPLNEKGTEQINPPAKRS